MQPEGIFTDSAAMPAKASFWMMVRFSGRRYTAVVSETDAIPEVDESRILPVETVERHLEPIGEKELELWRFMADYYLCSIGEVYKMAYPATKTAGETVKARAEERRELLEARTAELSSGSKGWKRDWPRKKPRLQESTMPR